MLNTANNSPVFAKAVKLARLAMPAPGAEATPEQQSATDALAALCAKHKLDLSAVVTAAAQPDTGVTPLHAAQTAARRARATAKPEAETVKPAPKPEAPKAEKPAKPSAADASRSADYEARLKLIGELRDHATRVYNGPSLAVRSNPKRIAASVYSDLFAAPKHRTTLAKLSVRDESALFTIITKSNKAGAFDPVALNLDSGIFSRLRSVGFITLSSADAAMPYTLNPDALAHARAVLKRAA